MLSRAIVIAFHQYTPWGSEFYEPILDFQLQKLEKFQDEYDKVYFVDSTWNIDLLKVIKKIPAAKFRIIKVDPSLRYYDAYKKVLPEVSEDLVLFMDNDMLILQEHIIKDTFDLLDEEYNKKYAEEKSDEVWHVVPITYDVVSITDTIGAMQVPLKTGNKLCPYWFATKKELLMNYLDVDWSPDAMPYTETFGLLTEAMLKDGAKVFEMEDDKTDKAEKNLGYYHVRAGSTVAMLLATYEYGDRKTYTDYLINQPNSELLRHCAWHEYMGGNANQILRDLGIRPTDWDNYKI